MNESRATTLRPLRNQAIRVDLRTLLVRAIERELDARCGGNPVLNRLEAEAQLDRFLSMQTVSSEPLSGLRNDENDHDAPVHAHLHAHIRTHRGL